jgi:hypothetical protein
LAADHDLAQNRKLTGKGSNSMDGLSHAYAAPWKPKTDIPRWTGPTVALKGM